MKSTTELKIQFTQYAGRWVIRGPADQMIEGEEVQVHLKDGSTQWQILGDLMEPVKRFGIMMVDCVDWENPDWVKHPRYRKNKIPWIWDEYYDFAADDMASIETPEQPEY